MDQAKLIELLTARGAARLAHPGGTLLAHLQRTAVRLRAWGAEPELITAGLAHAAYGTQGYPAALFDVSDREQLRDLIGDEAEAIVYAYCACDREHAAKDPRELRDRFGGEYWTPPQRLRRQFAELSAANELDVLEHGELSQPAVAAVRGMLHSYAPDLSQAAWSAVSAADDSRTDLDIAYRELGTQGPGLVLWHGGAAPELTWARQHVLSQTHRLRIPWRRGFAPSCPAERQDWEADARDLLRISARRQHVVGHSYGALSALIAAALAPERFASLILIEPPVGWLAPDDPGVRQLIELARAFSRGAPEARTAFLTLAGLPLEHRETRRIERLAHNVRDPSEAQPDLAQLRAADLPIAVVSGAHNPTIERLCDKLGAALGAERWVIPGSGHAVQRQAEFNQRLCTLIGSLARAAAEAARRVRHSPGDFA